MSADIVVESVPAYLRRVGDYVIQGSNNSAIVLGSDRGAPGLAKLDAGLGHTGAPNGGRGAGSVHLVTGLKDPAGNPDFDRDDTFIYMSMRTDVDSNFGTGMEGRAPAGPAAVLRTDSARIVVRRDVKISLDGGGSYVVLSKDSCVIRVGGAFVRVEGGRVTVDGPNIELGKGAIEHLLKGDAFVTAFNAHVHTTTTPGNPTTPPVPPLVPQSVLSQFTTVK